MKFDFIAAEKDKHCVRLMCEILGVSRAGFYAWRKRGPSARERDDERLSKRIRAVHERSRGAYGSPRVHQALRGEEEGLGRRRVARLMREEGLQGKPRRRFVATTDSAHDYEVAPNILDRQFDVERPNEVWAGDITYVPTAEGWMYLAVVVDLFSRRVVGWSTADHLRTELVVNAMEMAVNQRGTSPDLFHSDRGTQYASDQFQRWLADHGTRSSMSRKGDCWDNAVVESFFRTFKVEGLPEWRQADRAEADLCAFEFIEGFYNRWRLHSSLGYVSPVEYESRYEAA